MNPKAPKKNNIIYLKKGDQVHKVDARKPRFSVSPVLVFTVIVIFVGALGSAAAAAHMANTRQELAFERQRLNAQLDANRILAGQIIHPFSLEEIERIAYERLGMARPDPSQIIYINVPPVSHVTFNPEADILPRGTTFWEEMGAFFQGVFNRVFGG
ncbi:MAG: cell division protein FtsL [Defluviitaleaceae bacterium]|nr:cell division protein FtsL [Defluviitaleaceae bacterium]